MKFKWIVNDEIIIIKTQVFIFKRNKWG